MSETITSISKEDKKMSHFVGIGLVLGFLLPHTSTAFLLVNPLLCLFYQCYKQNQLFYKYNWIVFVPILLTLLINFPQGVNSKAIMVCLTILLYFFCFPIVREVQIPNYYFYFILIIIILTQLAYLLHIPILVNLLDTYYPISENDTNGIAYMQNNITTENMLDFRMGGLYRNSNQCSRYLTFLLASFLVLNDEKPLRKLIPFVIVAFYAVLLTGSRTGFVVASMIIIAYLFVDKRVSAGLRYGVTFVAVVGFLFMIFVGSDTFRGGNVMDTNSTDMKLATFGYYLSSENSVFRLLIGYLDVSRFDHEGAMIDVMNNFDSDYGSIIFSYGFVGFFAILIYYFTIFLKMDNKGRVFFLLLLWMYSSTIVKSYRALFLFMLLLSLVYGRHKRCVSNHK